MKPSFISLQKLEGFTEDSFSEERWIERTKDSGNSWRIEYKNENPFVGDGIVMIAFESKRVKIKGKQYARRFTITHRWSGEGIIGPVMYLESGVHGTVTGKGKLKFTSST